ncbi:TRAP transporter substrate-binding protein [Flavonifractor sp. DFI.6.63]|uniref:TRAP transporter substrate-binding protein n=1 Tax=Flavonifractor sp. DFI.6.63 TaxID=2963704 RepID=UPI00210DFB6D|nr:DctP family TRAP transporter solute-binding subunit [Flavonifractor sp. DFI.6.63]MCQ5030978.1 TRAP transporter substrate-binding protein [Flavonifractor sp. DFI.6.63]
MLTLKKTLSLVLAALLITALLAACGGGTPSKAPSGGAAASTPPASDTSAPTTPANDETVYTMKVAGSGIDNHTDYMLNLFEELVEKKSDGRIQVDYYPNLQLGSIREYYEACQRGQVQAAEGGSVIMSNFTSKLDFMSLPMLFDNREAVQAFMNGEVGQQLVLDIAEETNLYLLMMCENGFQALSNNKREIHSPDNMNGLKIRTQENPILLKIYETLGADPTPLAYSELFTALQQGTVDGQVNPAVVMATTNIWEVQKYVSDTNLMYDMISVAINYDFFKSLPEDLQQVVVECGREACQAELEYCSADYLGVLEENGMTVTRLTDEERAAFKEAVQPVYDWFRSEYDEPNLDKYLEAIDAANEATG